MATVKKGQLTPAPSYAAFWKQLREWKRVFWKRERKAARLSILRDGRNG